MRFVQIKDDAVAGLREEDESVPIRTLGSRHPFNEVPKDTHHGDINRAVEESYISMEMQLNLLEAVRDGGLYGLVKNLHLTSALSRPVADHLTALRISGGAAVSLLTSRTVRCIRLMAGAKRPRHLIIIRFITLVQNNL